MICILCGSDQHTSADCPMRPEDNFMMAWYLLQTMSQQEKRVVSSLTEKNIEFYCPEIEKSTRKKDKTTTEFMFRGYVFIRLDKEIGPFHDVRKNLSSGALQFVRFTDYPLEIKPGVIEAIKLQAENINKMSNDEYFANGDTVLVTEGEFKGLNALYKCRSGKDRAIVLLSVFGRMTKVKLNPTEIEKVSY